MAEVGVNIVVDVDIDVDEFMGNCSEFEINEVIEYLVDRDKIKPESFSPEEYLDTLDNAEIVEVQDWLFQRQNETLLVSQVDVIQALIEIADGVLQLTTEEEDYIKSLANRLV